MPRHYIKMELCFRCNVLHGDGSELAVSDDFDSLPHAMAWLRAQGFTKPIRRDPIWLDSDADDSPTLWEEYWTSAEPDLDGRTGVIYYCEK